MTEVDELRQQRHRSGKACDPACPTHGPSKPIEGDVWSLQRFIEAQDENDTFDRAQAELQSGRKSSHWMWFVFPQLHGLVENPSVSTQRYAIRSLAEAEAFVSHPVLRERYKLVCEALLSHPRTKIQQILGSVDAQKCHSSLTLFLFVSPYWGLTKDPLHVFFEGRSDMKSLRRIVQEFWRTDSQPEGAQAEGKSKFDNHLVLQGERKGDVWLSLSCEIDSKGDFLIQGHDIGDSEYEWVTSVKAKDVPRLIEFLGKPGDTDLMAILNRDWKPVKGANLEKLIKMSDIPSNFWNWGSFPS